MKHFSKLVFLIAGIIFNFAAKCQDTAWIYIGTASDQSKRYICSSRVKKYDNGEIKIWTKSEEPTYTSKSTKKTYYNVVVKELWNVNCENKTCELLKFVIYDSVGSIILAVTVPSREVEDVVPGSLMGETVDKICELFK